MTIAVEIYITSIPLSTTFDTPIVKTNLNICKFYASLTGNFLLKPFIEELHKNSNLPKSCPVLSGNYTMENVMAGKMILPIDKFKFKFVQNITGVLKKTKSRKKIISMLIIGNYVKNKD